jgi:hypothetical protein
MGRKQMSKRRRITQHKHPSKLRRSTRIRLMWELGPPGEAVKGLEREAEAAPGRASARPPAERAGPGLPAPRSGPLDGREGINRASSTKPPRQGGLARPLPFYAHCLRFWRLAETIHHNGPTPVGT